MHFHLFNSVLSYTYCKFLYQNVLSCSMFSISNSIPGYSIYFLSSSTFFYHILTCSIHVLLYRSIIFHTIPSMFLHNVLSYSYYSIHVLLWCSIIFILFHPCSYIMFYHIPYYSIHVLT